MLLSGLSMCLTADQSETSLQTLQEVKTPAFSNQIKFSLYFNQTLQVIYVLGELYDLPFTSCTRIFVSNVRFEFQASFIAPHFHGFDRGS